MSAKFSCFVTGTDTEIGKTLIASTLVYALAARGVRAAGMKPIAAGAEWHDHAWHNEDVDAHIAAGNVALPVELITPYLMRTPASPHIAAALDNVAIDAARILDCYRQIAQQTDAVVVEGVGGFRVPLADHFDTADLAVQFGLPVVLVVGLRLGCINHALLTAEAIAARGLTLAGWVANTVDATMQYAAENVAALTARLSAPLLGLVPYMQPVDAAQAARHLDLSCLPNWPAKPISK
jgi:dethiobiotin synthetase